MPLTAGVTRQIDLDGTYHVIGMNGAGVVLAAGPDGLAVVKHDGYAWRWPANGAQILAASLSEDGQVAILEARPGSELRWSTCIRIVSADATQERSLDADVTGNLAFDYATGGALAWAGDSAMLWLAAADDETGGLWVGRVELDSGQVRGASFPDPYAESEIVFAAASGERCSFNVYAGQHGGWAYVTTVDPAGTVCVERLVPSNDVTAHYETDDGGVVTLEGFRLVKRAADGRTIGQLTLEGRVHPQGLVRGPVDRALVQLHEGRHVLVDTRAMRVVDVISFAESARDEQAQATGSRSNGDLFATSMSEGLGRPCTRILFWRLPQASDE